MNITNFKDATELLEQLRNGSITSERIVREHINRLKSLQPSLNGATKIYEEEAIT